MKEIIDLLEAVHPMPADLKILLYETTMRREVPRKTCLLLPGDTCSHLYYIQRGMLACFHRNEEKELCAWLMVEKDIATSVNSFINQVPSTERIETVEDCVLWTLSKQELEDICNRFVEFRIIRQRLTDKYHDQSRTLDTQRKCPPEQYFDYLEKHYPEIVRRTPNHILASYMGIAESTLYKIKKERRRRR
ncbi:MAG TPA: cyclic nucleotide-binding domain-containing protein [Puia sp.]|nr:cyclic nucleotide-binding domain-containing protein [Puia sp.]